MKSKILAIVMLFTVLACASKKESQLDSLKKQRDKITQKIEKLESEIKLAGDSTANDVPSAFVAIEDIQPRTFNHYIEVQGKLDGDDNLAIYPESMGNLVAVYAKVGQHVSAGQVLAQINDAAYQEQLKALQSSYDLALETYQKQENLWKQQIGSEIQLLQAKNAKETLESQISGVKKQIDMTRIKSPINGNVEESNVRVGQAVSPSMPAFRVVNFSNLKVIADVAEAYTSKIKPGDEVIVYLPDIDQEINAKITFSSKYINPTNRTFTVEAQLKSRSDKLKANMVAVLKINDYKANKAFTLPMSLIQADSKGNYVFVAKQENNQYVVKKQIIQTGQIYNGIAEVVTGLEPGNKVITSGYLNLNEGEVVRF